MVNKLRRSYDGASWIGGVDDEDGDDLSRREWIHGIQDLKVNKPEFLVQIIDHRVRKRASQIGAACERKRQ